MKVLQNFEAEQEWVLEPGDMLYLPPHIAHDGVAEGECMTCSIGFRAPSAGELTAQFLYHLAERGEENGRTGALYRDPQQPAVDRPAELPAALVERVLAQSLLRSDGMSRTLRRSLARISANLAECRL